MVEEEKPTDREMLKEFLIAYHKGCFDNRESFLQNEYYRKTLENKVKIKSIRGGWDIIVILNEGSNKTKFITIMKVRLRNDKLWVRGKINIGLNHINDLNRLILVLLNVNTKKEETDISSDDKSVVDGFLVR